MKLLAAGAFLFVLVSAQAIADTAILVALPSELDAVRREVRLVGQPVELAGHRVVIGYRKGEKVYLAKTGAGNLNSAMVTQALVTRYKIDRVISIGIAGWVGEEGSGKGEERRAIGDIVVATDVINHQAGKETPGGFETGKESGDRSQKSEEYWRKCEALRSNAVEIAQALMHRPQAGTPAPPESQKLKADSRQPTTNLGSFAILREGRLVSGDSFIASTEKRKWLRETFHADAVDMVSAGIARVCEANGVPYVILRALSDNADESASADFAAFVKNYKESVTASIAVGIVDRIATTSSR
jgi:adenosylhomocysteine nucleosidase